jgi:ribosomal protein S18 acetylase RimI-like enzyme
VTAAVSSFEGLTIREMTRDDYDEVAALWQNTPGIYFGEADSRENLQKYWARNPGLSLVARDGEQLVGAVIGGHDGRRGTLHHLAIAATHQRRGIGKALVACCLQKFREAGINRFSVMVYSDNEDGKNFWKSLGWEEGTRVAVMWKSDG